MGADYTDKMLRSVERIPAHTEGAESTAIEPILDDFIALTQTTSKHPGPTNLLGKP
jgi:hypothetical protein